MKLKSLLQEQDGDQGGWEGVAELFTHGDIPEAWGGGPVCPGCSGRMAAGSHRTTDDDSPDLDRFLRQ